MTKKIKHVGSGNAVDRCRIRDRGSRAERVMTDGPRMCWRDAKNSWQLNGRDEDSRGPGLRVETLQMTSRGERDQGFAGWQLDNNRYKRGVLLTTRTRLRR